MFVNRTPLRVSLFGGGTDYPDFFARCKGVVIGGTIDKFVHITGNKLSPISRENFRLSYRMVESVDTIAQISHPIIREYLRHLNFSERFAFHTVSDIPGSSGLGSSSAFTVGFIDLLDAITGKSRSRTSLANLAIFVERELLNEPVGHQDQFHAAVGGFNRYDFGSSDVSITHCDWSSDDFALLNSRVCLVHTGGFRDAKVVLEEQKSLNSDFSKDAYLHEMLGIAEEAFKKIKSNLSRSVIDDVCRLLNESWKLKRSLASAISNSNVEAMINLGLKSGAHGAKLLGAGSEGFILFIGDADCSSKMKKVFGAERTLDFNFGDFRSTSVMLGLS